MPSPPNSLSVPRRRSLRDTGGKLLTVVVILGLLALLLADGVRYLGSLVPFGLERRMALPYAVELPKPNKVAESLNALAEKIAIAQGLPHEIPVQVRLIDQKGIQAFATLGGYVVVYQGLLKEIKSEEELAAVLAHEIAHLKHRHPTEALGRRVNLALLLTMISQDLAYEIARPSFGSGLMTAPHYTQDHEQAALISAGNTLGAMYGHLGGMLDLSATLQRLIATSPATPPAMVSAHPGLERAGSSLQQLTLEGNWKLDDPGKLRRPLPDWLGIASAGAAAAAPQVVPAVVPVVTPSPVPVPEAAPK
ncbi:MAG: M48 family metalloprotease [Burkholderiales bacterium]